MVELKHAMLERAHSVDLDPEIEAVCVEDLARWCSQKTQKHEVNLTLLILTIQFIMGLVLECFLYCWCIFVALLLCCDKLIFLFCCEFDCQCYCNQLTLNNLVSEVTHFVLPGTLNTAYFQFHFFQLL